MKDENVFIFFIKEVASFWFIALVSFFFAIALFWNFPPWDRFFFSLGFTWAMVFGFMMYKGVQPRDEVDEVDNKSGVKKLQENPIYLYMGQPCAICDTDEPVSDKIEGCDWCQDVIIAERTDWDPSLIKPILRNISDMTNEEALEVANLVWWALGNKKIESVEIKTTPIFAYAAIYFDWSPDQGKYDSAEDKDDWVRNNGEIKVDSFVLSLDNAHHTIKLFKIENVGEWNERKTPMQVYQSHKVTAYLLGKGFNLGILEEGTYIIRNQNR